MGLAAWASALDLWTEGDIAAAFRIAEKALRTTPTDFQLNLICLTYYIRARDSTQIYAFAERLVAAKNPAPQLRLIYAGESLFLWPLRLLGSRFGRNVKKRADSLDRWVAWAKAYLASHPRPIVAGGDRVAAERSVSEIPSTDRTVVGIIYLILIIGFLLFMAVQAVRKEYRDSAEFAATAGAVESCSGTLCGNVRTATHRVNLCET